MTGFELAAEEALYLPVRIITVPVPAAGRSVLTLDINQTGWQSRAKVHVADGINNEHQHRFRGPWHDARQFKDEQFRVPTSSSFVLNVTSGQRLLVSTCRLSHRPQCEMDPLYCLSMYLL